MQQLTSTYVLQLLQQQQLLSMPRYQALLQQLQHSSSRHPISAVAALQLQVPATGKIIDEIYLMDLLAVACQLPVQHLDPLKVDVAAVTQVMSHKFARTHDILATKITTSDLHIATSDPLRQDWQSSLQNSCKKQLVVSLMAPSILHRYLDEFYVVSQSVKKAAVVSSEPSSLANLEQLVSLGKSDNIDAENQHLVKVVDWILSYAFAQQASDIHIEPRRQVGSIRFRIDGVLHTVHELPLLIAMAVISRLKILARMDVAEKRRPQDGRIKTRAEDKEIELRLSTLPTAFGEKLVARIFNPQALQADFSSLGMSPTLERKWRQLLKNNAGILLVTGPTGSGKTTTLYSSLQLLANNEVNVCTIEDPIEMIDARLNQSQVHHDIGFDFAAGIRALLRQDPDIIMVGEIRDRETANMAIQAALTGHLVLSTLHTNNTVLSLTRLLELGVPAYLLNATLLAVVAQRLVRVLCPHCKRAQPASATAWQTLILQENLSEAEKIYVAQGCQQCRYTGYQGRTAIHELLILDDGIRKCLTAEAEAKTLLQAAQTSGMKSLQQLGAEKIVAGITSVEEVLRVSTRF